MQELGQQPDGQEPLRPLDPLGELMILDTRPCYPMGFFIECGCEGELDREKLHRAVDAVALRHPNTKSHIVWKGGRPFWKTTEVGPQLLWDPLAEKVDPWRAFDLATESGLRVIVFPEHSTHVMYWKIVLFGHHAVCDGLAACELLGEIWMHYAGKTLPPVGQAPLEPVPDLAEKDAGSKAEKPIVRRPSAVLTETLRFLKFFPAALGRMAFPLQAATSHENSLPSITSPNKTPYRLREFTADEIGKLRAVANARSVTLNALILAASMRVFAAWNREATGSRGGIRITMPVSLRQDQTRHPAENRIGYAFLDRTVDACQENEKLIASLAEASVWIKDSGAAGMFITALEILRTIPGLLWLILRLPICFSSAVVSNLGDAARSMRVELPDSSKGQVADNMVITHVVGIPPVRPRTAAAVGIARYGDHLLLSCLADEAKIGRGAAERLLEAIHTECLSGLGKS